jgi:hypothetical protein
VSALRTPLSDALRRAGYRTPEERLVAMLTEQLAKHAGSMKAAADAALRHIEEKEPALAWPLHAGTHHRRAVFARMETIRAATPTPAAS